MSDSRPSSVIVTGSSSGIGRAVARAFLTRGDRVVLNGRDRVGRRAAGARHRRRPAARRAAHGAVGDGTPDEDLPTSTVAFPTKLAWRYGRTRACAATPLGYEGAVRWFDARDLPGGLRLFEGALPPRLRLDAAGRAALWGLRPARAHEIRIGGRWVRTPRLQQAFGVDYRYTGTVNRALPIPALLAPFLAWARRAVDARLNGLLVNWYDLGRGHYIGPHRDKVTDLVAGSPIVTVSIGAERVFRLRPWKGRGRHDLAARDGAVFVLPWDTNLAYTHEVPRAPRAEGRRVSVTIRAFA